MWVELKKNKDVCKYLPDYSGSRTLSKKYLINIINTVQPNSIVNAVMKLKEKRKNTIKDEGEPIRITKSYLE